MPSAIAQLASRNDAAWPAIIEAQSFSQRVLADLGTLFSDLSDPVLSLVVTGSFGRGEASRGSDADWMLLVDGPSDPTLGALVHDIGPRMRELIKKPVGETGTFGALVSSHELVHHIAGTRDSNANLTRRMLLLAESRAITGADVRERVIRNILARYVVLDRSVPSKDRPRVPQFLLNDVVRYWRTVASDYASKMWDRQHEGWATRNLKLRYSRKVLYIWGLLASFSASLYDAPELDEATSDEEHNARLADFIGRQTDKTPLEALAGALLRLGCEDLGPAIFGPYDRFLAVLADPGLRNQLDALSFDDAAANSVYAELREASKGYREGVLDLFFDRSELKELVRRFGVF